MDQLLDLHKLIFVFLQGGRVRARNLLLIAELAGYHSRNVCCIEEIEAFFEIILQLLDCDEQSELVTVELLVDREVRVSFFDLLDAADASQGEESLYVRLKAAFNPLNATEPRGEQAKEDF